MLKSMEFKLVLFIILGIVVIVIISLLLDGIRKAIRSLDIAALGALLVWCGFKASDIAIVEVVSSLLYLIGGTLFAVGLMAFVLLKVIRHKRNVRIREAEEAEYYAQQAEAAAKAKAAEEQAATKAAEEADAAPEA